MQGFGVRPREYSSQKSVITLFSKISPRLPLTGVKSIIDDIANKSCEFLFNNDLKTALKEFLPEYIQYLAYKIEIKRRLIETNDKLEGIIWQNISNIFQSEMAEDLGVQFDDQIKEIEKKIKTHPKDLNLFYQKLRILIYFNQYRESLKQLEELLEIFPESEEKLK